MKYIKLTTDKGLDVLVNLEAVESFGKDNTALLGTVVIYRTGAIMKARESITDIWAMINDTKILH